MALVLEGGSPWDVWHIENHFPSMHRIIKIQVFIRKEILMLTRTTNYCINEARFSREIENINSKKTF